MGTENANVSKPTSDVDSIRKILFGDQVAQMEEHFNMVEKSISQLRTENSNLRQALEAEVTMREQAFQDLSDQLNFAVKQYEATLQQRNQNQLELADSVQKALGQFRTNIQAPLESKKKIS